MRTKQQHPTKRVSTVKNNTSADQAAAEEKPKYSITVAGSGFSPARYSVRWDVRCRRVVDAYVKRGSYTSLLAFEFAPGFVMLSDRSDGLSDDMRLSDVQSMRLDGLVVHVSELTTEPPPPSEDEDEDEVDGTDSNSSSSEDDEQTDDEEDEEAPSAPEALPAPSPTVPQTPLSTKAEEVPAPRKKAAVPEKTVVTRSMTRAAARA